MSPLRRTAPLAITALGGLTAVLAVLWLLGLPAPFGGPADAPALLLLPPVAVTWIVLVAALAAAATGSALHVSDVPRAVLLPVAATELAVFGVAVASTRTVALAGYLLALLLPAVLLVVAVQTVRHRPRLRPVVAVAALAAVGWGLASCALHPDALARLGGSLVGGLAAAGGGVVTSLLFAALVVAWALLVVDAARGTPAAARLTAAVVRHRVAITVVAALGPVPYALARATWLTPWPQFAGPITSLSLEVRLWGVLLGGAAALGSVLTVGLVRPWSEVFPRWVPALAGRPVPVRAAVVPGGLVAAVLCVSAVPMAVAMLTSDLPPVERTLSLLLFPFAVWGPALALAVLGYAVHRRVGAVALAG